MTGTSPGDMYTQPPLPPGETFLGYASRPPGRLRIARTLQNPVPGADVHPDCVKAYEDASALLASLGHEIEDIALPLGQDIVPFFETIYYGYATLTPVDPAQEQILLPLTRYLRERGRATAAPDFIFAQAYMQFVTRPAITAFAAYDAILTPTLARPPVPVGYFDEVDPAENFERQKRFTPWTALYNVSGLPAVSVPLHWNAEGLPIGVMLAGRMGDEGTLISLSAQLEQAPPWNANPMLLVPGGTGMGQEPNATAWWRLTPDEWGDYTHGTWSALAPMTDARLYYASAVLADG